jgi:hypothetical protein
MSALVGQSQGATGALAGTQAGNQLLALQSQQLSDLTADLAANGRAQALTEAERAAAAEQGREQRRRFLTPGTGYQPGNARMFQRQLRQAGHGRQDAGPARRDRVRRGRHHATAIEMTRKEDAPSRRLHRGQPSADPLRESLRRCQQLRRGGARAIPVPARLGREPRPLSRPGAGARRHPHRTPMPHNSDTPMIMGGTGVIDNFLEVFTRYIDSGFGLLGGEVAFIATTLIVIDVTLAALFWSWGADDDIIARLVKKTLFVGVFAYLIGNWNNLAQDRLRQLRRPRPERSAAPAFPRRSAAPGKVAQTGLDAGGRCSNPSPT